MFSAPILNFMAVLLTLLIFCFKQWEEGSVEVFPFFCQSGDYGGGAYYDCGGGPAGWGGLMSRRGFAA